MMLSFQDKAETYMIYHRPASVVKTTFSYLTNPPGRLRYLSISEIDRLPLHMVLPYLYLQLAARNRDLHPSRLFLRLCAT